MDQVFAVMALQCLVSCDWHRCSCLRSSGANAVTVSARSHIFAGGESALADVQDAREPLADAAKSVAIAGGPPQSYDYLLSCTYDAGANRLLLAAGNSSGSVAVFPVHEPSDSQAAGFGPPVAWLSGIHTEVGLGVMPCIGPHVCLACCVQSVTHHASTLSQSQVWVGHCSTVVAGPHMLSANCITHAGRSRPDMDGKSSRCGCNWLRGWSAVSLDA